MLKQFRHKFIQMLWQKYRALSPEMILMETALKQKGVTHLPLDHFAVIDLPGPHTSMQHLSQIFAALGYVKRGQDYLPDKQNDFLWMAEINCECAPVREALPQVVVADFRLKEMPSAVSNIIEKYSSQAALLSLNEIQKLIARIEQQDESAAEQLFALLEKYFAGRDWPLPTKKEFHTVQAFNELLAWVLVFGRRPNHFTFSVHLLNHFSNLADFNAFVEQELNLALNSDGGKIKGNAQAGIEQGSTKPKSQAVSLADESVELPGEFVEFVWRHPQPTLQRAPYLWGDYFTDFIAQQANRVIESLYV